MDKKLIIAALSAAVLLTACGKASDKDQGSSTSEKDSSMAVTASEESSSMAEESSESEDSSEADESSEAETEAPAESVPAEDSSAADSSAAEEPEPVSGDIVHICGTGYGFDADMSKWVDASENAKINAEDGTDGIEYILGWLGDNSSTVVFASNEIAADASDFDINEIAEAYFEKDVPPEGQTLIDWNTIDINGKDWMRREYSLDSSLVGVESRLLQYTGFNGHRELNVCFTITETSVDAIDNDLRELLWSVDFE